MTDSSPDRDSERRKRLWTAVGGTLVFVVLGVAVMPGLVGRQPVAADTSRLTPPAERTFVAKASEPAAIASESPAAWRDGAVLSPPPARDTGPGPKGFHCMIGPNEFVDIGSPVTGVIEEIYVERGDYVEAGQVLAQLEARVEEAAVRVARARAERTSDIESGEASRELGDKRRERARQLFESNALSLDQRQEVEAQATLAGLELKRAHEDRRLAARELQRAMADLARRTIHSPVSGFVIERLMTPGEVVDEQTMLRIAQVDPLRVEAILPSDWFGRMKPGNLAEIVPEAPLDEPRRAEVAIVDPIIDGASGTFGIHLLLPNPDYDLPAGLRCHVRFLEDPP